MQLLGENPRCQRPTKCNLGGGSLWHIPAVTSESCGRSHSHSHGVQGPRERNLSAWDKQSPGNLCAPYLPAKKPPIPAWLDTNNNFLCPSMFSFLCSAAHPRVSCSIEIQTCQSAWQGEKEVFKQNFNCSITQILLSHCVQGLCFSGRVLCPLGKSDSFQASNCTNLCHP